MSYLNDMCDEYEALNIKHISSDYDNYMLDFVQLLRHQVMNLEDKFLINYQNIKRLVLQDLGDKHYMVRIH